MCQCSVFSCAMDVRHVLRAIFCNSSPGKKWLVVYFASKWEFFPHDQPSQAIVRATVLPNVVAANQPGGQPSVRYQGCTVNLTARGAIILTEPSDIFRHMHSPAELNAGLGSGFGWTDYQSEELQKLLPPCRLGKRWTQY